MLAYCLFSAKVVLLPQTNRIIMALPIDFITRTRALLGEEFDRLEAALSADVPVSIRINPMKGTPAPKAGAPVAWCESGFICRNDCLSPSILYSMRGPITCRKRLPCFWNKRSRHT